MQMQQVTNVIVMIEFRMLNKMQFFFGNAYLLLAKKDTEFLNAYRY